MGLDDRGREPSPRGRERGGPQEQRDFSGQDARPNLADLWTLIERGRQLSAQSHSLMLLLVNLFRDREK
jgi:hypothetical protein